ncbi:DedA family protein [Dactylosporangium vinaceum]|uniref:DedA family protein n=1 Tax=Dactylosporangium vinaceum TaxID=53362 RepID=A0ABV5M280_9ACTN|nr:DedA family protein [Dactylosporangium vinaceum]UAB99399.1 DedA family protein [Dactylosporangium vinaceum]
MSGFVSVVADWATSMMNALGSPGAGLANALDSIFPILPSEVVLPVAGFAASRGELGLAAVIVWTTIGSVAGSLVVYGAGAWLGRDRVRALAARMPLVKTADVDRAEAWFARHGGKTVLLGRMLPVFRVLISVPAGVERMPLVRFIGYTAIGSAVWNTVFVVAGYSLGEHWERVEAYGSLLSKAVIAMVAAAVIVFVAVRLRRPARRG